MKQKIAKKWIKALRSGLYQQGSGFLRDRDNHFCCLGVLCNLHAQAHPKIAATQLRPGFYLGQTGILPFDVMTWAGMQSNDGSAFEPNGWQGRLLVDGTGYFDLTEVNDDGLPFTKIADIIEENWERL